MTSTAPHVVLVGMMGTGKTTVGRLLAERLGRRLIDSDELIEARAGRTVREIWLSDGEPAFRVLETAALRDALADPEPLVIAAAGGVVLSAENRAALRDADAVVVWLRADPSVLVGRVGREEHRPLLDDDPATTLQQMLHDREPLYREVAELVVETDATSPDDVVEQIVALVGDGPGVDDG